MGASAHGGLPLTTPMLTRVEHGLRELKRHLQESPDASLDVAGACRLTGLDEHVCGSMLSALERARFVRKESDGSFRLKWLTDDPSA